MQAIAAELGVDPSFVEKDYRQSKSPVRPAPASFGRPYGSLAAMALRTIQLASPFSSA